MAENFVRKHPEAKAQITEWHRTVKAALWQTSADVKNTYRTANYVQTKKAWVFDIASNRIVSYIDFVAQSVRVADVFTHSEYDRWSKAP
jgi:mRNA interferase HigB